MSNLTISFGDNLEYLERMESNSVQLIYIDPPFNTGKVQTRTQIKTIRDDENGDRTGFKGLRYKTIKIGQKGYYDYFDDFLSFLEPRLSQSFRILKDDGSLFFHIDYREVHYCKVLLDSIFGRENFQGLLALVWS